MDREELLRFLSEKFNVPPERIQATFAWKDHSALTRDSLDITELVMDLEEELAEPKSPP
jgi:acyl carrier protein